MRLLAGLLALFLTGCASSYQPEGLSGGFSDIQLDKNVFQVSYQGNAYTRTPRLEEMALLRAADLTVSHGFRYFIVLSGQAGGQMTSLFAPSLPLATPGMQAAVPSGEASGAQGMTMLVVSFAQRPDFPALIYDATLLCQSLGAKFEAKCGRPPVR